MEDHNIMKKARNLISKRSIREWYIVSFMLIALIPIGIILGSFYRFNVTALTSDIQDINVQRVSQVQLGFENEVTKHINLAETVYRDKKLMTLMKREEAVHNYEAIIRLNQYLGFRDMDVQTGILVFDKNQVYTRTGLVNQDVYFRNMLSLDDDQTRAIFDAISSKSASDSNIIIPIQNNSSLKSLLFAYTLPVYSKNPSAILITTITHQCVEDLFRPIFSKVEGTAFILNAQQDLIFYTNKDLTTQGEHRDAIKAIDYYDENEMAVTKKIHDTNLSIIHSTSDISGITYGVLAEDSELLNQVNQQIRLISQTAVLAIIVCIILISLFSRLNYKPVERLMRLTSKEKSKEKWYNEYSQITNAIQKDSSRVEKLELIQDIQRPFILERLLAYAMYSSLSSKEVLQLFDEMNINFNHPRFFVICIKALRNNTDKSGYSLFKKSVIDLIGTDTKEGVDFYIIERWDDNEITAVINCSSDVDQEDLAHNFNEKLTDLIEGKYFFVMGVGSAQPLEELKKSLYEASILTETQIDTPVAFVSDFTEKTISQSYKDFYRDVKMLQMQLKQGDEINAKKTFRLTCESIEAYTTSFLFTRYSYSHIISAIIEISQQVNCILSQADLHELMSYQTDDAFKDISMNLISEICEHVSDNRKSKNSSLRDQILQYVHKNISDPDLSLETIGQEFSLSPYYVSRFFRDQNNMNIKDFIAEQRIDLAKELLLSTNLTVSEIVTQIGYLSTSSFIRKFRLSEGCTPGDYRANTVSQYKPIRE